MPTHADLEAALAGARAVLRDRPTSRALQSIVEQLEYLLAFASGENNGARVVNTNFGVLAAREVEEVDLELASRLQMIQAAIRRSPEESGNA